MSDIFFEGDALAVAQVVTVQITAYDAATTYIITMGGKTVSVAGDTDVNTTAAALQAALDASTIPEFAEVTWTVATDTITGTADTAGVPFTAASSVSGGTGTIGSVTTSTANQGPNDLTAANVSGGVLPGASDIFTIYDNDVDLLYSLDALSGTLTELNVKASNTANIGLPRTNESGSLDYIEYRTSELTLDCSTINIGEGEGDGSGRIAINSGTVQTALNVYATASSEDDYHAVRWRGAHASNVVNVRGDATVDIAPDEDHSATVATLTAVDNAQVRTSDSTTLTTVDAQGNSSVTIDSAAALSDITTINAEDEATVTIYGSNDVTTVNIPGSGTVDLRNSAAVTITNLNIGVNGQLDLSNATAAVTITNCTCEPGRGRVKINDPHGLAVFTNAIDCGKANPTQDFEWNFGDDRDIKPS